MEKHAIYVYDKFICSFCGTCVEPRKIPCRICGNDCRHTPEYDYSCPRCGAEASGSFFNTWERAANAAKVQG